MLAYLRSKAIPLTALRASRARPGSERCPRRCRRQQHGATAAQVRSRGCLISTALIAIPKAARPESQKANLDALGIRLDDEDRAAIATLPKDQRFVRPPFAPEWDAAV